MSRDGRATSPRAPPRGAAPAIHAARSSAVSMSRSPGRVAYFLPDARSLSIVRSRHRCRAPPDILEYRRQKAPAREAYKVIPAVGGRAQHCVVSAEQCEGAVDYRTRQIRDVATHEHRARNAPGERRHEGAAHARSDVPVALRLVTEVRPAQPLAEASARSTGKTLSPSPCPSLRPRRPRPWPSGGRCQRPCGPRYARKPGFYHVLLRYLTNTIIPTEPSIPPPSGAQRR